MNIAPMSLCEADKYAQLYAAVFNGEPWNDSWTAETARKRITDMMKTETFLGFALYDGEDAIGLIWGQREQFFNGVHFQIQEFCVLSERQGEGCGTMLLEHLEAQLRDENVVNIYLITSHGERTEGFYQRKGFETSSEMILMTNSEF